MDNQQTNVSSYWNEPKANMLDTLIESCTSPIPDTRPTMKMVSDELTAWLDIGADRSVVQRDIRVIAAKLRPIINRHQTDNDRQVKTRQDCERIWRQLESLLEPLAAQISDGTGLLTSVDKNNHVNSVVSHPKKYRVASYGPSMNVVSKTVPGNPSCGFLISGIGLRSSDDQSTISLIGAHAIRGIAGCDDILIWKSEREILPNTALENTAIHDLVGQLHETLPDALNGLSNHLSGDADSMENAE